jgi:hypothetical protein
MVLAVGVNLVALQLGVLFGGSEDDRSAFGVDGLGKFVALFRLVAEKLAEHFLDVLERMAVAVPKDDVVSRLASALPHGSALFSWGNYNDGFIVAGGE